MVDMTKAFGLTASLQKAKFMVVGCGVLEDHSHWMMARIEWIIVRVSDSGGCMWRWKEDFGALRRAVFKDAHLSVTSKRSYVTEHVCVVSATNAGYHSGEI